jgi:uncharacterized protein YjbJ (UPF0337 family)
MASISGGGFAGTNSQSRLFIMLRRTICSDRRKRPFIVADWDETVAAITHAKPARLGRRRLADIEHGFNTLSPEHQVRACAPRDRGGQGRSCASGCQFRDRCGSGRLRNAAVAGGTGNRCAFGALFWRWRVAAMEPQYKLEMAMNWDQIEGNWMQMRGKAQAKWGDISGDDWDKVAGRRDQIVGLVQARYGRAKTEAEQEVDSWFKGL